MAPVTFGLAGPVRGPGCRPGAGGTLGWFLLYQLSSECPEEAVHPWLMGVFPLGGCLSVVAGGLTGASCTTALHPSRREPLL